MSVIDHSTSAALMYMYACVCMYTPLKSVLDQGVVHSDVCMYVRTPNECTY